MVGHLGDTAVAAVGIGNRAQFVLLVLMTGLAGGVGVLGAQYFGANALKRISQTTVMAIIIAIIFLIPIIIANFYLADDVVSLASNDNEVINLGASYLKICIPGLLFIAVVQVIESAFRAMSKTKTPMVFGVIAILLNIVLNNWFINGGLGVPALGVDGAAWATTISRAVHLLIILYAVTKISSNANPKFLALSDFNQYHQWIKLFKIAVPMMLSYGVWSSGTFIYQLIYGQLGTQELAVMSLLTPIEGLFIALFFGFASACSIQIGHKLGQNDFAYAWRLAKGFSISAPIVAITFGAGALSMQSYIFMPFSQLPSQTLALASEVFLLIALGTCIKIYNMTVAIGILRAGGDNKYCLFIDTIGMWFVSIPLTFIAAFYFNLPLFWVAFTAYSEEVVKFFMFTYRMKAKYWLKNLAD
ncbi:MATE family efflux transporter [Thalassotalea profundi]|uniref:Multidrug-efflux transporter n=2 Tax=Thalassotalea profundi TaxID=2036687 RepID=A0ABQ3ILX8_9GAMM|nr:MATE family efflux transporter [Thalassotalea profundi]